jgi:assimilatory nitrate reductase catalytic subunit
VRSNDTVNAGAHVLLPAAAWGEKEGTVTNSERRISRQRAFLPLPGEAKPDWLIVTEVARRMGFAEAFAYETAGDVFREHAALSAFENDGARDFDLGGLAAISDADYDALEPVQWPVFSPSLAGGAEEKRFFAAGGFFTSDRKARFVAPEPPALQETTSPTFPFRLNTGRIRDQWHTMTRSGLSPRLSTHLPEPYVEVHPDDANAAGLADGGFAKVSTAHGACIVKVVISENQRPGSLFVPIHWSDETASAARVGDLVSARTDPYSGQPEAKATPAAVTPVSFSLQGFARTHHAMTLPDGTWWARVAVAEGAEYRLATSRGAMFWHDFAYGIFTGEARLAERIDGESYRAAAFVDGDIDGWLCVGPAPLQPGGLELTTADVADGSDASTLKLLPSHQYMGMIEPIVCACFQVGLDTVRKAVSCGAVKTVADIGQTLRAGTNCGSCLPELKRIIVDEHITHPD